MKENVCMYGIGVQNFLRFLESVLQEKQCISAEDFPGQQQMTVVRVKEHCLYFIKIENQNEKSSGCKQKATKCVSKNEKYFQQK